MCGNNIVNNTIADVSSFITDAIKSDIVNNTVTDVQKVLSDIASNPHMKGTISDAEKLVTTAAQSSFVNNTITGLQNMTSNLFSIPVANDTMTFAQPLFETIRNATNLINLRNPFTTTGLIFTGIGFLFTPILDWLGFGPIGIIAATYASRWQASIGLVPAGGLFASLQSWGMGGAIGGIVHAVTGAIGILLTSAGVVSDIFHGRNGTEAG
ncbi:hypothetical protein MMC25_004059 [Agyrium rufum]|nr:hypothetical protein [Agyrium rufum]